MLFVIKFSNGFYKKVETLNVLELDRTFGV